MDHQSMPPPATSLVILAGDLLAAATKTMLDELAGAGHWPAGVRVRQCLEAYEHARMGDEITSAQDSDPQRCTISNWQPPADCAGAGCVGYGHCDHAKGTDCFVPRAKCDELAPVTTRSAIHG